jgi:hypothetical protein
MIRLAAAIVWQSPGLLPLVALLAITVCLGAGVLYLPQARRLRWRWRVTLLALRLAALAALAVSLLQPTFTRPARPRERAAIVVVVDHSRGMGIKDRQQRKSSTAARAQLVALADGLGLLNPGVRQRGDSLTSAIIAAQVRLDELVRAHSELQYAVISGRGTTDATARLHAATADLQSTAAALAARRQTLNAKSAMAKALAALQDELDRKRADGGGDDDAWIASVRKALDMVAHEADSFQALADRSLYDSNPVVRQTCDSLAGMSRLGLAQEALTHPTSGLLSNLPPDLPIYGFAIGGSADGAVSLPLFGVGGRPVRRLLLDTAPTGVADLAAAVRAALDQMAGTPVQAVVLFSDGRQVGNRTTPASPADLTGSRSPPAVGVPVYAIAAAAPTAAPRDLSLSHVVVPPSVFVGEPFSVHARLHGVGLSGGANAVEVRCVVGRRQGVYPVGSPALIAWDAARLAIESALGAKRYTLNGASATTEVEFDELRADEPGAQPLTLDLADLEGEITAENNIVERWVKVCPRPTKVMFLAAAPSWDYRYLRDAIRGSHAGFDLIAATIGGADGTFSSISPQQILEQDVVVLLDVPIAALSAAQQDAIWRAASERGGGVVLAAGPAEHLPMEYSAKPLVDLLPVSAPPASTAVASAAPAAPSPAEQPSWSWTWRTWAGETPAYRFSPWASGALGGPWSASSLRWDALPPLFRYLPIASPFRAGARPLLVQCESGEIVAAEMPVGAGKAVLIGLDETWRWRYKAGAAAHEQVWLNLIRGLTDPPYAAVGQRLSLDVSRAAISAGEAVEVRAKLSDAADGSSASSAVAAIELRILRGDEPIRTQTLAAASAGRYKGTILGLPPGDYRLEAHAGAAAATETLSYPLHVIGQYDSELEDPSGDRESLRRIVEASGGQLLTLEQMRELPRLLAAQARQPAAVTVRLWDSSYLFVFVVACFAAEWAVRKRMGLA